MESSYHSDDMYCMLRAAVAPSVGNGYPGASAAFIDPAGHGRPDDVISKLRGRAAATLSKAEHLGQHR